ncbi:hypothetical protein BDV06DRAFT_57134 [Aspergillus oleicola]
MPADVLAKGVSLHHSIRRPLFSHLFRVGGHSQDASLCELTKGSATALDFPKILSTTTSHDEAVALVTEWACSRVGQILGRPVADIEPSKPIHVYGVDSLVAVDLKNWFDREIGARVTVFAIMGNMPLRELCVAAARGSRYRPGS